MDRRYASYARLQAQQLEVREVPSTGGLDQPQVVPSPAPQVQVAKPLLEEPRGRYAVGTNGGGTSQVNVYDAKTGAMLGIINPFGKNYTGGVTVATGDVTGDGIEDIVVGAGRGRAPSIKVYDGRTLREVGSFHGLSSTFTGGTSVAVGDISGDGRADIVVGAGVGSMSQVKAYDGAALFTASGKQAVAQPTAIRNFIAFDKTFRGGVSVSVGDLNNDGIGDIVVGQGPGAGGVRAFDGKTSAQFLDLKPYGPSYDLGVSVAVGDVNGDGKKDIVTGAMRGSPTIIAWNADGSKLASYQAFDGKVGSRVALQDIDGDGRSEVIVSVGSGKPGVRVLNALTGQVRRSFPAVMPHFNSGLTVG